MQHGASTLPPEAFDAFPRAGACEIHLATDFQNMVYEHPQFPADLKAEMYAWIRENATEERKPKDTEEQFIYKARKKAIGPFKQRMWDLGDERAARIGQSLEERFSFLMKQLKINDTASVVARVRHGAADSDRPRGGDRRRRREDHGGREKGRRARRLTTCAGFADSDADCRDGSWLVALALSAAACASHHTGNGLVLRVDRPGAVVTISHDALPRLHGRDGDAVRPQGVGARRSTLTPGDRVQLPPRGEEGAVVGRSRRGRLRRAGRCRAAADAGGAGAGAGRLADARLQLTDQAGAPVALSALKGKVVAVTFIYSRCPLPDYCPRMIENFRAVRQRFATRMDRGPRAAHHQLRSEVRHAGDPDALRGSQRAGGPGWHFLTGDPANIERVCNAFGIQYWAEEGLITHTLQTAVIDREGRLAATVEGKDFTPQQLGDLVGAVLDR